MHSNVAMRFHRRVWRAFSALCVYSKFGHHPHPIGYLCAKFRFCRGLRCWASPCRKIAYSITHSHSITQSLNHPACLMPRELKLSLRNKHANMKLYDFTWICDIKVTHFACPHLHDWPPTPLSPRLHLLELPLFGRKFYMRHNKDDHRCSRRNSCIMRHGKLNILTSVCPPQSGAGVSCHRYCNCCRRNYNSAHAWDVTWQDETK